MNDIGEVFFFFEGILVRFWTS